MATTQRRVRLVSVDSPSGAATSARVVLEWGGSEHTGTTDCSEEGSDTLRCVAQATLRALEAVVAERHVHFRLHDLVTARILNSDALLVGSSVELAGQTDYYVGISLVDDDEDMAAVRAVLNSTNRSMTKLLAGA